jgi:hypothetical protein
MSFDLNLNTLCDHLVFRELAAVEDDRRTIRFSSTLGAIDTVKLYATDNLVPSSMYEIVSDPNQINVNQDKVIQFKEKWKSPTDYFEITYVTLSNVCTKCVGSKYLDDLSYDVRGGLLQIRNEYLLMQNVEKFVVTTINSNPFHLYVGTGLVGLIGKRISSATFLQSQITAEIGRALQKLQDLQGQYLNTGRAITEGEMLATVDSIQVTQDADDPSIFRAEVTVTAQSGKTVQFTQIIRIR